MTDNKALVREYLHALSGQPKTAALIARYIADDGLVKHINEVEAAFPCYELISEDMIAERDLVTVRATFRGIHRGPFAGIEATGRNVSASLIIIYRLSEGKIIEHWMELNSTSLLQQLNAPLTAHVVA